MTGTARKYFLAFLLLIGFCSARAQDDGWPSPEVEQMYKQAREYLSEGNLQQAIVTYTQAIDLAPRKMILYRDLGRAYYLVGRYDEARKILEPVLESAQADPNAFQTMSACYVAQNEKKKARAVLQQGLGRFQSSGMLYHDIGKLYYDNDEKVYALEFWLDGIRLDPRYYLNYYEAARTYMETKKVEWAIVYGEIFLNIEHETPRAQETRQMLIDAYKMLYYNLPRQQETPDFSKKKGLNRPATFDEAVYNTYISLAPVVSDGVNVETLTMLRTRFLMTWFSQYSGQYPFSLFAYQDVMLRNGFFDSYNEWLFGKTDNAQEYEAWVKFHPNAIKDFENWQAQNPLIMDSQDFHNDKDVDNIFVKKKK